MFVNVKKYISVIIALLLISVLCMPHIYAESPYAGYEYDDWGNSVDAPNIYRTESTLNLLTVDEYPVTEATDIYIHNEKIYLLDSGNNRVLIFNKELELCGEIDNIRFSDGEETSMYHANGIFVNDKEVVIADKGNMRAFSMDMNGVIQKEFVTPEDSSFTEDFVYSPSRVLADKSGNYYVLSSGFYYGAIMFDSNAEYHGFYGSNSVELTIAQSLDLMWRKILSSSQKEYMVQYVPVEFTSFDIDEDGFIYTVTANTSSSTDEIKKLNSEGANVLDSMDYGDLETHSGNWQTIDTSFIDVCVDDNGIIYGLDSTRGRVFAYTQGGTAVGVFGAMGEQTGTFMTPVAIDTMGDRVFVLDTDKASITVFSPTDYGSILLNAIAIDDSDTMIDSPEVWEELLKYNSGNKLAYSGLGKYYLNIKDYKQAMHCFELSEDRENYSLAFELYRVKVIRKILPYVFFALIALAIIYIAFLRKPVSGLLQKRKERLSGVKLRLSRVFLHPAEYFDDVRLTSSSKPIKQSLIVVLAFLIGKILEFWSTAFLFNTNDRSDFNILMTVLQTVGIILVIVIADTVVSSLRNGEAKFKHIWTVVAVSFIPHIITIYINIILSHFMLYNEASILNVITLIGWVYTVILLYIGIKTVQQYEIVETMVMMILDVVTICIVLFLAVLVLSVVQQFFTFIKTLIDELLYRL